ncbi:MAG: hypothetical protein WBM02_11700 [bacterium]
MMTKKVLAIILIAIPTIYFSSFRYLADDAVISYRFCQNLLLGRGLVSYENGPHVEGYSNPTLVFLTASIAKLIGATDMTNLLRIGLYLNTLALLLCGWLLLKWGENDWTWISAPALIIFFPTHLYRQTGLETCLYTMFFTLSVYGFSVQKYRLGFAASLLTALSRPEGIGMALWLTGIFLYRNWRGGRWRPNLRMAFLLLIIPFGLFLLWRYWYFGQWVSMTSLVKTNLADRHVYQGRGLYYIFRAITSAPILIGISALTAVRFLRQKEKAAYEITAVAFQIFFIIAVGGDEWFFERYRFLLPIFPLLFRSLAVIPEALPRFQSWAVSALIILVGFYPMCLKSIEIRAVPWIHEAYHFIIGVAPENRLRALLYPEPWPDELLSRYLHDHVPHAGRGLILTCGQAGSMPLHWRGIFHDRVGLVSPEYGLVPGNKHLEVFRANQPDIYAAFAEIECHPRPLTGKALSDLPSPSDLDEMGYQPVLIYQNRFPPYAWEGQVGYHSWCWVFSLYTKNPDLIQIENPAYYREVHFNGRIITVPVIENELPA